MDFFARKITTLFTRFDMDKNGMIEEDDFDRWSESLIAIIRAMGQLKIGLADPNRVEDAKKLFALANTVDDTDELSHELSCVMKRLWHDGGVRVCFARSREYQLNDSAP